ARRAAQPAGRPPTLPNSGAKLAGKSPAPIPAVRTPAGRGTGSPRCRAAGRSSHRRCRTKQTILRSRTQRRREAGAGIRRKIYLSGCGCSAFKPQLERSLEGCGEIPVHFEELLAAPDAVQLVVGVIEKVGDRRESHEEAAWPSGSDKSITVGNALAQWLRMCASVKCFGGEWFYLITRPAAR